MRGKVGEVGEGDGVGPDLSRQLTHFLVRTLEKFFQKAQFVHDFKRRRVDGIATEITQKVRMLLQHHDLYTHAGQEKAQHHAGRTASRNTALRAQCFAHEESENRELELITEYYPAGVVYRKGKGRDIGYALAASSCEEAKRRGRMHHHGP